MTSLNAWFRKPLGTAVSAAIQQQFSVRNSNSFHRYFYDDWLQVGTDTSMLTDTPNHNAKRIVLMQPHEREHTGNVQGEVHALPFESQCFSTVFLPFTLEYSAQIRPVIDEAWRVLRDDGYLIITGINPWSLWGAARWNNILWPEKRFGKTYGHTSLRVYATLYSQGFHLHWIKSFFYRPPLRPAAWLQKTQLLEPTGQIFWPYPGGIYLLLAQKRVIPLSWIGPAVKSFAIMTK